MTPKKKKSQIEDVIDDNPFKNLCPMFPSLDIPTIYCETLEAIAKGRFHPSISFIFLQITCKKIDDIKHTFVHKLISYIWKYVSFDRQIKIRFLVVFHTIILKGIVHEFHHFHISIIWN